MSNRRDYAVGYGRPPTEHQFRKGRSGNPKGRSKGVLNFKTDLRETLKAPVPVMEGGQRRTVSTQQAMLMRLRQKALAGDARALDRLMELARFYGDDEIVAGAETPMKESDRDIIERALARRLGSRDAARPTPATPSSGGQAHRDDVDGTPPGKPRIERRRLSRPVDGGDE